MLIKSKAGLLVALKALSDASFVGQLSILFEELVIDDFDPERLFEWEYRISVNSDGSISVSAFEYGNKFYDLITKNENSDVSSDITCRISKEALVNGIEINMSMIIYCDLPEDDYKTLDMLGKVHRTLIKSRVEESIFCAI